MANREKAKQRAREVRARQEHEAAAAERRRKLYAYGFGGALVALVVVVVALALGAGGDDPTLSAPGGDTSQTTAGAEAGHVHGLGVNPADESLLIATHTGLYSAAKDSPQAPRVGTSDRDVMGFSVVGPNHFVGSGHPGSDPELPGNLGLIESRDGGRTWKPISLLGEADFHVLRASGEHVYGFDGAGGRFMASTNLGRRWQERDGAPAPFDLAIDPSDPRHVLTATEDGLQESRDEGRTWRQVSDQIALLGWASPERLFLLDQDGQVLLSPDGGRTAEAQGRVDGEPVSFMADDSGIYVALADGRVLRSTDDGSTFTVRAEL